MLFNTFFRIVKRIIYIVSLCLMFPFMLLIAYRAVLIARLGNSPNNPRLVWGSVPIINNSLKTSNNYKKNFLL